MPRRSFRPQLTATRRPAGGPDKLGQGSTHTRGGLGWPCALSWRAGACVRPFRGRLGKTLLAALPASLLLVSGAQAYRPFDLTDAEVARRQNFEIEVGPAEWMGVGSEHSLRAPALSINYGVAKGLELSLEGANRVALEPAPHEPRARLEDIAIAMKQVLRRGSLQDAPGISVAMEDAILLPERGESHLGAAARMIASSAGRLGLAHFNVGAERRPERRDACSAGVVFEAGDKFGIAPAIELEVEAAHGAPAEHSATLGLIYVPGESTEYDLALRVARMGDENILEIRAGSTFQFSGRKALARATSTLGLPLPARRRH